MAIETEDTLIEARMMTECYSCSFVQDVKRLRGTVVECECGAMGKVVFDNQHSKHRQWAVRWELDYLY